MKKEIKNILQELYMIDPELKKHEKDLQRIISQLLKSKPDIKIDKRFVQSLKTEILGKTKKTKNIKSTKINFKWLWNLSYALGGAIIVFVLMFPLIKDNYDASLSPEARKSLSILPLEDESAFGNIGVTSDNSPTVATGLGGGGLNATFSAESVKMIAPFETKFNFVYSGEKINIEDTEMPVYKKNNNSTWSQTLSDKIKDFNSGLLNMNKFSDIDVINLSFNEDKDFGYSVYITPQYNTISINSNWYRWPHPEQDCQEEKCFESLRLKESDVPEDSILIEIADKFLKEYNVDMSNYGAGKIISQWRDVFVADGEDKYVPEIISVIYPLILQGQTVYEQGGTESGITVGIDIRYNKVAHVNNITTLEFSSSKYEIENNFDKILEYAKKGGMNMGYYNAETNNVIDIELDKPFLSLIQYYKRTGNNDEQLFIPAFLFPIKERAEGMHYMQPNVVVPLIKEWFKDQQSDGQYPGLVPKLLEVRAE